MSAPAPTPEVVAYLISDLREFREMVIEYLAPPHTRHFATHVEEAFMDAAHVALENDEPLDADSGPGRMLLRALFEVAERSAAAVDIASAGLLPSSGLAHDPTTVLGHTRAVVVARHEYDPSVERAEEWQEQLALCDSAAPGVFWPAVLMLIPEGEAGPGRSFRADPEAFSRLLDLLVEDQ